MKMHSYEKQASGFQFHNLFSSISLPTEALIWRYVAGDNVFTYGVYVASSV